MVQLWFPGLRFNGLRLTAGQLLDISLLGVGIKIPPWDMDILPAITFWDAFLILDTDWVVGALSGAFAAIPNAVWSFLQSFLSGEVAVYYETHHNPAHIVRWFGVQRGDPDWREASEFDLNNDGVVDDKDVQYYYDAIARGK